MLSAKLVFTGLFLALQFSAILKAQPVFEPEIICNDFCTKDSTLFFQEINPENIFAGSSWNSTNLNGPYFDHFPQIRSDIFTALCYFPELANARIRFSYKPIRQTMNSRPSPGNIFRNKANRRYNIIVNNNKGKQKGLPFNELSSTIKTGWLGHELAHICEYEKMNNRQTFLFAVKYVFSKKFIRKVERYTDLLTIEHGLAFPLFNGADYLLRSKDIGEKYRNYAITNGLSLNEIMCLWCKSGDEKGLSGAEPEW